MLFPALKQHPKPDEEIETIKHFLDGSKVEKIGRHGKYFWIRFQGNKIMLMHFGMTGMIKLKNIKSHLTFMENGGDKKVLEEMKGKKSKYFEEDKKDIVETEDDQWPPKFTKFELSLDNGIDFAFVDPRRLGRIRFLNDIEQDQNLFEIEPLKRQGPDYSKSGKISKNFKYGDPDPQIYIDPLSATDFAHLINRKKKPIKSLLLDQEHFAGVGNWVGDEILYQSRIHPNEVLAGKFDETSPVIKSLYSALISVTKEAVEVEGEVRKFPDDWLMIYRWGKRRKKAERPKVNGHPIDFVTVGGRTSCYVPELQKIKKADIKTESS